jgi:hypothetical protein
MDTGGVLKINLSCRFAAFAGLQGFQHFENTLGSTDKHAFEGFGQTAPFQGVAAGAFTFGHDELQKLVTLSQVTEL